MKNVIVSLSANSNVMRECLLGIVNYANARRNWKLKILPDPFGMSVEGLSPQTISEAVRTGIDGIITGLDVPTPGFKMLIKSGIPLVLNNAPPDWTPDPAAPISFVKNNDLATGIMGAEYLHSKGNFNSYAYVPSERKCFWSTLRKKGFAAALIKSGKRPVLFNYKRQSLEDWLLALPKPTAIMVVCDYFAISVVETCTRLGLTIPEQVSILGVDDDELFCKASRPQLSSIKLNNIELGRRTAMTLEKMMRKPKSLGAIYVPPIDIVERESTRTPPPATHIIHKALSFIDDNYGDGISAFDVADHLGISPTLLRLRFRTLYGKSVRDVILDRRLQAAKVLLRDKPKMPLSEVAKTVGFASACRMSHFFLERTDLAPVLWRQNKKRKNDQTQTSRK